MSKRKSRYATKNNIHRIGFHVIPKNEKQDKLIRSIKVYPITVTIGCAEPEKPTAVQERSHIFTKKAVMRKL